MYVSQHFTTKCKCHFPFSSLIEISVTDNCICKREGLTVISVKKNTNTNTKCTGLFQSSDRTYGKVKVGNLQLPSPCGRAANTGHKGAHLNGGEPAIREISSPEPTLVTQVRIWVTKSGVPLSGLSFAHPSINSSVSHNRTSSQS